MQRSSHAMFEGPRGDFNESDDIDNWSDGSSSVDSDSSGEEWVISITYIKPPYVTDYATLPPDAAIGHPHIVNTKGARMIVQDGSRVLQTDGKHTPKLEGDEKFELSGADAVATFLYNSEPEALVAFLDKKNAFFILHCEVQETDVQEPDIIIMRIDKRVVIGTILRTGVRIKDLPAKAEPADMLWDSCLI